MTRGSRSRRDVVLAGAAALVAMDLPLSLAQTPKPPATKLPAPNLKTRLQLPPAASPFVRLTGTLGSTGPWGEVRVRELKTGVVPVYVSTPSRAGILDLSGRRSQISLGGGSIVLTSAGIRAGGRLRRWNRESIVDLLKRLETDAPARQSLLELRGALITTYAHAVSTSKTKSDSTATTQVMAMARGVGQQGAPRRSDCTTVTVIDTVVRKVEEVVEVWLTAEERYDACVANKVKEGIPELAAMALCAGEGFIDLLVGTFTVLRTFTEEVTKTYIRCKINEAQQLIDFFTGTPVRFPDALNVLGLSAAAAVPDGDYTKSARALLNLLGPSIRLSEFTICLLQGQWSIAAAETPVRIGSLGLDIPYGMKVCVSADCARLMSLETSLEGLSSDGEVIMALLNELNPAVFAIFAGVMTAGLSAALVASVSAAAAGPAYVIILAFLLLMLYYAVALRLQLLAVTDQQLADGKLCIEHPTFVVAAMAVPSSGYSLLIPPIVTG